MKFLGKDISGPFTIPSGIITVTYDAILHMAKASDELGVITTKSIGPEPRSGNREPILAQNDSSTRNSFQNAVGLAGPGCATFAKELSCSEPLPPNKFLLVSIFGKNTHEFIAVAKTLEKYADGFELNFSCPHAEGHGSELCSTPGLATEIIRSLRDALPTKPVVPKLSPNLSNHALQELVRDFVHAGASAFSAINTVGPKKSDVLTKKMGGISGPIVFERAREVVRLIRTTLDAMGRAEIPILGMGGVATCEDVQAMRASGANVIGIGTSLLGLDTAQCVETLKWLNKNPSLEATAALKALQRTASNMVFRPYTVKQVHRNGNYNAIIDFRESIETRPGQFVMVWIPGHGEKPFAPAKRNPLTLVVRNVGALTSHLTSDLEEGSCVYIRGVYGTSFYVPQPRASPKRYIDMIGTHLEHPQTVDTFVLVGGSTGIAPLLLLAEDLSNVSGLSRDRILVFLGGRSARDIYFKSEFESIATVYIATGDGSEGSKGTVIDVMKSVLKQSVESNVPRTFYFYNCGPEMMMFHAYSAQKEFRHGTLECSIERYMKCGVGICGVCTCDGLRMCADGPVMGENFLSRSSFFGKLHRDSTTKLLSW